MSDKLFGRLILCVAVAMFIVCGIRFVQGEITLLILGIFNTTGWILCYYILRKRPLNPTPYDPSDGIFEELIGQKYERPEA